MRNFEQQEVRNSAQQEETKGVVSAARDFRPGRGGPGMDDFGSLLSREAQSRAVQVAEAQRYIVEAFAHRMRSYIQVLMGYTELLHDDIQLDLRDPAVSYLEAMTRTVVQMRRAVESLVAEEYDAQLGLSASNNGHGPRPSSD